MCGLGELCKHDASDAGGDEDAHDALHAHHNDGERAVDARHPAAVPDGVLRLHAEQEGRGEVHHVLHADCVLYLPFARQLKVTMDITDEEPDESKKEPRDKVGGKEVEESPGPGKVDGG